jgi:uncharacterized protein Yka (UPF0111/DUF47 family)
MKSRHWFLPATSDILGVLRRQTAITIEGMDALMAWSQGQAGAAERVRDCELRADEVKRELREALTAAFTTPLDPEDLFELSRGLDGVLKAAKNTVREAEVMHSEPDQWIGSMATELAGGIGHLDGAFAALSRDDKPAATVAADRAVKSQRRLEHVYRQAMSALIEVDDLREIAARRELYRRLARTSEVLIGVAERVWYSVLKQS